MHTIAITTSLQHKRCTAALGLPCNDAGSSGRLQHTYNLFLSVRAAAVRGGKRGRAFLEVPGSLPLLGDAADGQRVDAVCIAVAVAAVLLVATVTRRPHKYGALTTPTLQHASRVIQETPTT